MFRKREVYTLLYVPCPLVFQAFCCSRKRKEVSSLVKACFRGGPESVHKIEIKAQRWKGLGMTSNQCCKYAVMFEAPVERDAEKQQLKKGGNSGILSFRDRSCFRKGGF